MKPKVITARVADDIYKAIAAKAESEGVSLSAVAARLLSDALEIGDDSGAKKPAWALDIEARLTQLESQPKGTPAQHERKGKRRR